MYSYISIGLESMRFLGVLEMVYRTPLYIYRTEVPGCVERLHCLLGVLEQSCYIGFEATLFLGVCYAIVYLRSDPSLVMFDKVSTTIS